MLNDIDFAYIAFVTNNSENIKSLKRTIDSFIKFSKYKFIVYCVGFMGINIFKIHENVIVRYIDFKPFPTLSKYADFIINDAMENGLKSGCYIKLNVVLSSECDKIKDMANDLTDSPYHDDNFILFNACGVPAPHAGHE